MGVTHDSAETQLLCTSLLGGGFTQQTDACAGVRMLVSGSHSFARQ